MSDEKPEVAPEAAPAEISPARVRGRATKGHSLATKQQQRKGGFTKAARARKREALKAELVSNLQEEPESLSARFGIDPALIEDMSSTEIEELWQKAIFEASIERGKAKKAEVRERLLIRARRQLGINTAADEAKAHRHRMREPLAITLNLAEYTPYISLDGRVFRHGHTYTVPRSVYETLADLMAQTWRHQAELDGKRRNYYNQQHGWLEHGGGRPRGSSKWAI